MSNHYKEFFPEIIERGDPKYLAKVPAWRTIEAQGVAVRDLLMKQDISPSEGWKDLKIGEIDNHRRRFGTVQHFITPEKFDVHNIHCFQYLPAVAEERDRIADLVGKQLKYRIGAEAADLAREQVRHELAHSIYHHAMWRRYGRRVYVLDETTYTLLSETPLPDLPASILAMPEHAFYLKFPPGVFKFGVHNMYTDTEDLQDVEGVMIAMDTIDPDSPQTRELAFMNIGANAAGEGSEDRNVAYISVSLGPDANLGDVRFQDAAEPKKGELPGYAESIATGSYHLGVITPRVILGFLLYLQSEHPDIEPVAPPPRRAFKDIRSEAQRKMALATQASKLRGTTRLPILYVGRHLAEEIEQQKNEIRELQFKEEGHSTSTEGRSLDHPVWVRGHWKRQPYGEGRLLRRMIWIRPYLKGPDTAEYMKARAAKVQQAQHAESKPQIEVTPITAAQTLRKKIV